MILMINMNKIREWILPLGVGGVYDGKDCLFAIGEIPESKLPNPGYISVIEKSEYDKLQERYNILQEGYNHVCRQLDDTIVTLNVIQDHDDCTMRMWTLAEYALELCSEHKGNK